ncbi:hypothetical protein ABH935_001853 [Catenulispora sp. GAS73]|uniref:hypothetical protein n=1 Tax=Catenulispora sp. GAS73 TaxID=3156269 RepID=UPI003515B339
MRADGPAGRITSVIVAARTAATLERTIELADKTTAVWGGESFLGGQPWAPAARAGAQAHLVPEEKADARPVVSERL